MTIKARKKVQRCRVCGCTDREACPGGCAWVEDDLCSACFRILEQLKAGRHFRGSGPFARAAYLEGALDAIALCARAYRRFLT